MTLAGPQGRSEGGRVAPGRNYRSTFIRALIEGGWFEHEPVAFLDVGCSGGIDEAWRQFEPALQGWAFDPDLDECARLRQLETNPSISYVAGFVGLPLDDPTRQRSEDRDGSVAIWNRTSTQWAMELARVTTRFAGSAAPVAPTRLADETVPVVLPAFLRAQGASRVDLVKIDIDSWDHDVLRSLDTALDELGVLGVLIEVNFTGASHPEAHTFHNMDRYLREHGFDLFSLYNVRRYSTRALPIPFELPMLAQTMGGRVLQADAVYLRDPCAAVEDWSACTRTRLLKMAAIFDLFQLPDCAAELLVTFRERLDGVPVDALLDELVPEGFRSHVPYQRYVAAFAAGDAYFYPNGFPERDRIDAPGTGDKGEAENRDDDPRPDLAPVGLVIGGSRSLDQLLGTLSRLEGSSLDGHAFSLVLLGSDGLHVLELATMLDGAVRVVGNPGEPVSTRELLGELTTMGAQLIAVVDAAAPIATGWWRMLAQELETAPTVLALHDSAWIGAARIASLDAERLARLLSDVLAPVTSNARVA